MLELDCLCVWTEACQLGKWHKWTKLWVGWIWIFSYSGKLWDFISQQVLHWCLCFSRYVCYCFGGCSWRRSCSHSYETRPQRKFSQFLTKSVPQGHWGQPEDNSNGVEMFSDKKRTFVLPQTICNINAMTPNSLELVYHQTICRKYKRSS